MRMVMFKGAESGSPQSAEWHAWRAQGLGGSDAGVVAVYAGLLENPPKWFKSPARLWEIKCGLRADDFTGNYATERGQQGEPIARALYEQRTGILVSPVFGEMDEWPVARSSYDGIALDANPIIEIKCPGEAAHAMARNNEVPPYYKPQIAHQALVAWGHPDRWEPDRELHYVSCIPEKKDTAIVRIRAKRMREFALRLFDAEQAFWNLVQNRIPPAGLGWRSLAEAWLAAKAQVEAAEAALETALNAMKAYAEKQGMERVEGDGVVLAMERRKGAIDYKKAFEQYASGYTQDDLEKLRRKDSKIWSVRRLAS